MDTINNCIEKYKLLTLIQERVFKNKMTRSTNWKQSKKTILDSIEASFFLMSLKTI